MKLATEFNCENVLKIFNSKTYARQGFSFNQVLRGEKQR